MQCVKGDASTHELKSNILNQSAVLVREKFVTAAERCLDFASLSARGHVSLSAYLVLIIAHDLGNLVGLQFPEVPTCPNRFERPGLSIDAADGGGGGQPLPSCSLR